MANDEDLVESGLSDNMLGMGDSAREELAWALDAVRAPHRGPTQETDHGLRH